MLLVSRDIARFFHFSLETEFNALRFINYTIPRLSSTLPWSFGSLQSLKQKQLYLSDPRRCNGWCLLSLSADLEKVNILPCMCCVLENFIQCDIYIIWFYSVITLIYEIQFVFTEIHSMLLKKT